MGIVFNDSLSHNADDLNQNIGIDGNAELVGPSIEQPIDIKNKEHGMCFILRHIIIFYVIIIYIFYCVLSFIIVDRFI
jgi:hypothetical protein